MNIQNLFDKMRAWPWLLVAVFTTLGIAFMAPQQLGLLLWSLTKITWGAWIGYWVDRVIFPYARPHALKQPLYIYDASRDDPGPGDPAPGDALHSQVYDEPWMQAQLRRAGIIAAVILALGLGV